MVKIQPVTSHVRHVVRDDKEALDILDSLAAEPLLSVDTETTSLHWYEPGAVTTGVCLGTRDHGYYFPIRHKMKSDKQLDPVVFLPALKNLLGKPMDKVLHNAKFDMHFLLNDGVSMAGTIHDTLTISKLVHSDRRHALKLLARQLNLADNAGDAELAVDSARDQVARANRKLGIAPDLKESVSYDYVPIDILGPYGADDAVYTFRLFELLMKEVEGLRKTVPLFDFDFIYNLERQVLLALFDMERSGVLINAGYLKEFGDTILLPKMRELQQEIDQDFGFHVNIGSSACKQGLLELLGCRYVDPKTGNPTANAAALSKLSTAYDEPGLMKIVRWQGFSKLHSAYVTSLPKLIVDGKVHCTYNQTVQTGRCSCSEPNLQQVPVRSAEGAEIRKAFGCPPGFAIVSIDLSQIELRVAAELSGDPELIRAYRDNLDLHALSASKALKIPYEKITKNQREIGKTLNFIILYGGGPSTVAQQLAKADIRCSEQRAKSLLDNFKKGYPQLTNFIKLVHKKASSTGKAFTKYGRMRIVADATLPSPRYDGERELSSDEKRLRKKVGSAQREAFSHVVQGTAADLIKMGMAANWRLLKDGNYKTQMVMTIHDELIFYVHKDELVNVVPLLRSNLESFIGMERVAVKTDSEGSAVAWGLCSKIEDLKSLEITLDRMQQPL